MLLCVGVLLPFRMSVDASDSDRASCLGEAEVPGVRCEGRLADSFPCISAIRKEGVGGEPTAVCKGNRSALKILGGGGVNLSWEFDRRLLGEAMRQKKKVEEVRIVNQSLASIR